MATEVKDNSIITFCICKSRVHSAEQSRLSSFLVGQHIDRGILSRLKNPSNGLGIIIADTKIVLLAWIVCNANTDKVNFCLQM